MNFLKFILFRTYSLGAERVCYWESKPFVIVPNFLVQQFHFNICFYKTPFHCNIYFGKASKRINCVCRAEVHKSVAWVAGTNRFRSWKSEYIDVYNNY